jgi:hypothetical protein
MSRKSAIHKFNINGMVGECQINIPENATFLHAGLDPSGYPCLWYQVYLDAKKENKGIHILMTGEAFDYNPFDYTFLGTIKISEFMLHVYEYSK